MSDTDLDVHRNEVNAELRRAEVNAAMRRRQVIAQVERAAFLRRLDDPPSPRAPTIPVSRLPSCLLRPRVLDTDAAQLEKERLRHAPATAEETTDAGAGPGPVLTRTTLRDPEPVAVPPTEPAMAAPQGADGMESAPPLGQDQIERLEAALEIAHRLGQPELVLTLRHGPMALVRLRVVVLGAGRIGLRLSGEQSIRQTGRREIAVLVEQLEAAGLDVRDVGWVDDDSPATSPGPPSL